MGVGAGGDWRADLASVLLTEKQIQDRVAALGTEIAAAYQGKNPLVIGVLKGSVVFLADLIRRIDIPLEIDLVCLSSYGQAANSSGQPLLLKDLAVPVAGRHLLVVEDIIDSGVTLSHLLALLQQRGPASIGVCALLSKPARRETDVPVDYTGFEIPDEFVVGYGLDYAEHYRSLPYVAVLKPEVYETPPTAATPSD